ncbi:hypothetical protein NEHOM01_2380 [Nematocida homosporus]|uniref:uncharacterized protein n=1 Tax=Nematocida homosporus TaxID=1912981 RepID=UPI00222045F2|nr:uncharacterized protein NEHOM01_2380 [Nematocida homosporus]KAI5187804.1 hypothetical protein NEHOM01_2380 [Nematocida homosporus]
MQPTHLLEPTQAIAKLIDLLFAEKKTPLSVKQRQDLLEYLLPYAQISSVVPSENEIRRLAGHLPESRQEEIDKLLQGSTPETRKALYFLFKAKDRMQVQKRPDGGVIDSEDNAHLAAKGACIGVYLSWFRDIAEGKSSRIQAKIDKGLFEICYLIYKSGEAYLYLSKSITQEEEPRTKAYAIVIKQHLAQYRKEIYEVPSKDLFDFYIQHSLRMKHIARLCHVSQEFLSFAEESDSSGCVLELVASLKKSPWTDELATAILTEYRMPLSEAIVQWIRNGVVSGTFIREIGEGEYRTSVLLEEEIPEDLPLTTAKEILYMGKTSSLLAVLNPEEHKRVLNDLSLLSGGIFNVEGVSQIYQRFQNQIQTQFFGEFKIMAHLQLIRDVFFLFRGDFGLDLMMALAEASSSNEVSVAVDESLERCFGNGPESFVDVVGESTSLSLIYKPVFPYSVVTSSLAPYLTEAFEYFWALRLAIANIQKLHQRYPSPQTFVLALKVSEIEYLFFEQTVQPLWNFQSLSPETLFTPESLTKWVERVAYHLISTCKEACTLSLLQLIIAQTQPSVQPPAKDTLNTTLSLLQKITMAQ